MILEDEPTKSTISRGIPEFIVGREEVETVVLVHLVIPELTGTHLCGGQVNGFRSFGGCVCGLN